MYMHNYLLYDFTQKRFLEVGKDWWYCGKYIVILEGTSDFVATNNPHFQGLADYLFHSESYKDVDLRNIIEKSYLMPFDKLSGIHKILAEKHKMPIYGYNGYSAFDEPTVEYCVVICGEKKFIKILNECGKKAEQSKKKGGC